MRNLAASKEFHIPSLDGLRAAAILLVFVSHISLALRLPNYIPGSFGVTVFFFLSGFLITTLLRLEYEKTGKIDIKRFYLRRTLRIFPTLYIVLAIAVVCGLHPNLHTDKELMEPLYALGQAFHLTNYQIGLRGTFDTPIAPGTEVFWSLAVEEHFYLLFPWAFLLLVRLGSWRRQGFVLLGACASVFLWRCLLFRAGVSEHYLYVATDCRADSILYGCVLALIGNPALDSTRITEKNWKWVLLPLGLAGILLSILFRSRWFLDTVRYSLQGICLIPVYVVAVRYPNWGAMRILNLSLMKWIGLLSYAIYLFHPTGIRLGVALVGESPFALGLVAFIVTIAVSAALYYGIERPLARLRKRYSVTAQASLQKTSASSERRLKDAIQISSAPLQG